MPNPQDLNGNGIADSLEQPQMPPPMPGQAPVPGEEEEGSASGKISILY